MKWEGISQRIPGRSPVSCRLHYQNYLEKRCDWSDEKKSKLARVYERYVNKPPALSPSGLQHLYEDTADEYPTLDSSLICGEWSQTKLAFHGEPSNLCTGN